MNFIVGLLKHPVITKFILPIIVGESSAYIYIDYKESNSITIQEIQRFVPFRIGVGKFWFDDGNKAYGSLISSLRVDGLEITEMEAVPDRKIAQGLQYIIQQDLGQYKSVPLPSHRPCLVEPLEDLEVRELKVWRELISLTKVEVLILGEINSEPKELRLWVGGYAGPRSVTLPFSTKKEITQATDLAKVAILIALVQVAEDKLNLEKKYDAHVPKVLKALKSIEHTLACPRISVHLVKRIPLVSHTPSDSHIPASSGGVWDCKTAQYN